MFSQALLNNRVMYMIHQDTSKATNNMNAVNIDAAYFNLGVVCGD